MYVRADILAVLAITLALISHFRLQLFDKEDLLAMGCLVLAVLINGVLLLNNYWSVGYHETIAYQSLKGTEIERCTHVRTTINNKKQKVVKRFIVPI